MPLTGLQLPEDEPPADEADVEPDGPAGAALGAPLDEGAGAAVVGFVADRYWVDTQPALPSHSTWLKPELVDPVIETWSPWFTEPILSLSALAWARTLTSSVA